MYPASDRNRSYSNPSYSLMVNCESTCRMVSRATATTIKIAVPLMVKVATPVSFWTTIGRTATRPRNTAPQSVMRFTTPEKNFVVFSPGRMPGTNPPLCWRFFATSSGLNVIAV